jgi:hypothetical protein
MSITPAAPARGPPKKTDEKSFFDVSKLNDTQWSGVLWKLIICKVVKIFPDFYAVQRFITVCTTVCRWTLP